MSAITKAQFRAKREEAIALWEPHFEDIVEYLKALSPDNPQGLLDNLHHPTDHEYEDFRVLLGVVADVGRELMENLVTFTIPKLAPPIFKIPDEAFIRICTDLRDIWPMSTAPLEPSLGWVNVTHVCRRWRRAALNAPTLWSFLHSSYPPSTWRAFIEHAKDRELFVSNFSTTSVRMDATQVDNFFELLAYIHRPESKRSTDTRVDIRGTVPDVYTYGRLCSGLSISKSGTHLLKSLSLEIAVEAAERVPEVSPFPLKAVFRDGLEIQDLKLVCAPSYSFQSFKAQNLRSLELVASPSMASRQTAAATASEWRFFMDALETMTALESLRLHGVVPKPTIQAAGGPQLVLKKLKELDIYDDHAIILRLYKELNASTLTNLSVRMPHYENLDLDDAFSTAQELVDAQRYRLEIEHFTSLQVTWEYDGGEAGVCRGAVVALELFNSANSERARETMTFTFATDMQTSMHLISRFIEQVPDTKSLSVRFPDDFGPDFEISLDSLRQAFRGARNVGTLTVQGESTCWAMIAVLNPEVPPDAARITMDRGTTTSTPHAPALASPFTLFPLLARLDLVHINFASYPVLDSPTGALLRSSMASYYSTPAGADQMSTVSVLRHALSPRHCWRKESFGGFIRVVLAGSKTYVMKSHITALRAALPGLVVSRLKSKELGVVEVRDKDGQVLKDHGVGTVA
ncbi:hypothetical protein PENSPDRAFT_755030 [Peniophora sp. CONT]|nr:hypothetical protein PENSPDRAFT_755030 [Peniophora sp. CONT]